MATGPHPRLNAARTLGEAWADLLAAIDRHWAVTAPVPDQPETMPVLPRDDPRSSRSIARAAADLRYGITALADPGEIAELLDALDTALEDSRARCFTNAHAICQYCDIQTEYEYRDHDEFPPERFPLRREALASFRDRLDRFIAGRPGALAVCVRLGYDWRAIASRLSDDGGRSDHGGNGRTGRRSPDRDVGSGCPCGRRRGGGRPDLRDAAGRRSAGAFNRHMPRTLDCIVDRNETECTMIPPSHARNS